MLKRIKITNFLSCQDTEIEFENITALIGRNAAGKTNVLRTIQWVSGFALNREGFNEAFNNVFNNTSSFQQSNVECELECYIDKKLFKYEMKLIFATQKEKRMQTEQLSIYKNNKWITVANRKNSNVAYYINGKKTTELEVGEQSAMITAIVTFLPQARVKSHIVKIFLYLSSICYYDFNKYTETYEHYFFEYSKYKQWLENKKKNESSVVMRLLHLWYEDKSVLEEIQELIGNNGLNLIDKVVIEEFNLGNTQDDRKICVVGFKKINTTVGYGSLSFGTQRVLSLLLALLYDKNTTLLLEQPEDGIHSGLLKKIIPLCMQYADVYNKQLIIATHSADVINLLKPESIRLVRMTEAGTKVIGLQEEQIELALDYIENEGSLFEFIESRDDE